MDNKKNSSNHNQLWHTLLLWGVVAGVALLGFFKVKLYMDRKAARRQINQNEIKLRENERARNEYIAHATEFQQATHLRRVIDSLNLVNDTMIDNAQKEYINRIDRKYTLGRFFNTKQIEELNKIMVRYSFSSIGDTEEAYTYITENLPMTKNTPLTILEMFVQMLNIPTDVLEDKAGVIFSNGYVIAFKDPMARIRFDQYIVECERIKTDKEPNFDIAELARREHTYQKNQKMVSRLSWVLRHDDSLVRHHLNQFDATKKQLLQETSEYRKKLK